MRARSADIRGSSALPRRCHPGLANQERPWAERKTLYVAVIRRDIASIVGRDLMRVLIVTAESRGGVAPFTGRGQRLQ